MPESQPIENLGEIPLTKEEQEDYRLALRALQNVFQGIVGENIKLGIDSLQNTTPTRKGLERLNLAIQELQKIKEELDTPT